jgi:hypothetical protein
LKIKYKPNKTIVIYEQLEAGTEAAYIRDDFIFELKTKVDNIVPLNGGWIDLLGYPTIKGIGVNDPAYVNYIGNIMQYQFASNEMNELSFEYHLPHGYVLGSDMFIHTHWSTKIVDLGNAKWYFEISFAKGYDRGAFSEPIIVSVIQGGSTVARSHQIAEVQFTDDGTLKIDRTLIEPDGLILVRMYRDPADIDDTLTEAPFVHFVNVHMQIDKIATPNRNYPFE